MPRTTIELTVILDLRRIGGIHIEPEKLVGELIKIKSGEYENLLRGTIVSAEEVEVRHKK